MPSLTQLCRAPGRRALLVLLFAATLLVLTAGVAGAQAVPPKAVTTQGDDTRNLYFLVFGIGIAVFVIVEIMILWVVFRYRRKSDDEFPPQIAHNNLAEFTWTFIPLVIVLVLFAISFVVLEDVTAAAGDDEDVVAVDVLGQQWAWAFNYGTPVEATVEITVPDSAEVDKVFVTDGSAFRPFGTIRIGVEHMRIQEIDGDVLTVERAVNGTVTQRHPRGAPIDRVFNGTEIVDEGRLEGAPRTPVVTVPVGRMVRFNIASQDVLHAFYTPQFLTKLDAVPGRVQTLWVKVTKPGDYASQCAEFCGRDHARMIFTVRALPADEYDDWFAGKIPPLGDAPPPPADDDDDDQSAADSGQGDAANGQRLFFANGCNVCHGDTGQGGIGPTIASTNLNLEQVIGQYRSPRAAMPPFPADRVPDEDVADIYAWLQTQPLPDVIVPGEGTP